MLRVAFPSSFPAQVRVRVRVRVRVGVTVRVRVGVRVRVRVGVRVTVTVRVGQPPEAFAGCECREHDVSHAQPQRTWYVVVSTW